MAPGKNSGRTREKAEKLTETGENDNDDNYPVNDSHCNPQTNDDDSESDLMDNISPTKELNAALNEQKESQRRAFDILIKENVSLERKIGKSDEENSQLLAQCQVRSIELDAERVKTADLERQVREMQSEMTVLIRSAKKAGVIGKGKGMGSRNGKQKADGKSGDGSDGDELNKPGESGSEADGSDEHKDIDRKKVHDLQLRLLRLTEEDERKSRMLISLQRELENNMRYTEELENHVDDNVKDHCSNQKDTEHDDMRFTTTSRASNMVFAGRPQAYSYRKNVAKESAVCVIS